MGAQGDVAQNTSPTPQNKSRTIKYAIIGVAIIVILVVLFAPIFPQNQTVTVNEPYQRLATYRLVDYGFTYGFDLSRGIYVITNVTIRNTDSYGGTFVVTHYAYDQNGLFGTQNDTFYLGAGQTYSSIKEFDVYSFQQPYGDLSVLPPTVTAYHLVQKTQVVYMSLVFWNS